MILLYLRYVKLSSPIQENQKICSIFFKKPIDILHAMCYLVIARYVRNALHKNKSYIRKENKK